MCVHVHLATHHWQQEVQSVLQYGLPGDLDVEGILQASEAQVSVDLRGDAPSDPEGMLPSSGRPLHCGTLTLRHVRLLLDTVCGPIWAILTLSLLFIRDATIILLISKSLIKIFSFLGLLSDKAKRFKDITSHPDGACCCL